MLCLAVGLKARSSLRRAHESVVHAVLVSEPFPLRVMRQVGEVAARLAHVEVRQPY